MKPNPFFFSTIGIALLTIAGCGSGDGANRPIAQTAEQSAEQATDAPEQSQSKKETQFRPESDLFALAADESWRLDFDFEGDVLFILNGEKKAAACPSGLDHFPENAQTLNFRDGSQLEFKLSKGNCAVSGNQTMWFYSLSGTFLPASEGEPVELEGCLSPLGKVALKGKWIFADLGGISPPVGSQGKAYIEFNPKARQISGYDGCNKFSGTLEISGNTLKIGPIASTKMACPNVEGSVELVQGLSNFEFVFQVENGLMLTLEKTGERWTLEKSL
jgi:heat shock protein HslJ